MDNCLIMRIKKLKEQVKNLIQQVIGSCILAFTKNKKEKRITELEKENAELREKYLQATDEGTSFAHLKSLERENTKLKHQIEKMKCCQNCKYLKSLAYGEFSCDLYGECKHYSKWEIEK